MADAVNLNVERAMRANDNRLVSAADMLADALSDIEKGIEDPTRAMVLFWDEDADSGAFATHFYASNLKGSEMLALLEMVKTRILREMGLT